MVQTQFTLGAELKRAARQRASELRISLAEYIRRLVARDLARPEARVDASWIFDLGNSVGSNIAVNKDSMIAQAFESMRRKAQP